MQTFWTVFWIFTIYVLIKGRQNDKRARARGDSGYGARHAARRSFHHHHHGGHK